jgi:hypothetical protein
MRPRLGDGPFDGYISEVLGALYIDREKATIRRTLMGLSVWLQKLQTGETH